MNDKTLNDRMKKIENMTLPELREYAKSLIRQMDEEQYRSFILCL